MQRLMGLLVGAVGGLVFVFVNGGEPLPGPVDVLLKVMAALALIFVIAMFVIGGKLARTGAAPAEPATGRMYGKGYLIVVAAEVVALFAGFQVLRLLEVPTQVNVAWVAFVVGVHFIGFVFVWKEKTIAIPGVALSLLGVAGFILAAAGTLDWVPFVSGVLSGLLLLATGVIFSWLGVSAMRRAVPTGV